MTCHVSVSVLSKSADTVSRSHHCRPTRDPRRSCRQLRCRGRKRVLGVPIPRRTEAALGLTEVTCRQDPLNGFWRGQIVRKAADRPGLSPAIDRGSFARFAGALS